MVSEKNNKVKIADFAPVLAKTGHLKSILALKLIYKLISVDDGMGLAIWAILAAILGQKLKFWGLDKIFLGQNVDFWLI